jgi:hypothetical protein
MRKTQRFDDLYRLVTEALLDYLRAPPPGTTLTGADRTWFKTLIGGFQAEYAKWSLPVHPEPEIQAYLDRLDDASVYSDVRLAGHVFLHVAYDLPRVVADTLAPASADRSHQGQVFVQPGPLFSQVFMDFTKGGGLGVLGRIFGRVDAMRIMAFWVLALRTTAWIHAGVLADANPADRTDFERRMGQALNEAVTEALTSTWILGIPELDNAQLLQVAPAGLVDQLTSYRLPEITIAVLALFTAGLVARRRQRVLATIEVLGALVNSRVQRALRAQAEGEAGPATRRARGA